MPVNKLGLWAIVAMTLVNVASVRNFPNVANMGPDLLIYVTLAALGFMLPATIASAVLSSRFDSQGGVFLWIDTYLGRSWAFAAVWFQWIENVIYYPVLLSFIVRNAMALFPVSSFESSWVLGLGIPGLFCLMTLFNTWGIQFSNRISWLCTWLGLLLPLCLIFFGALYQGYWQAWQPLAASSHVSFAYLTDAAVMFCGIELATVHASDVRHAKRVYPKALLLAAVAIYFIMIVGSYGLLLVVPQTELDSETGLLPFFALTLGESWLPAVVACVVLGALGGLNNWIIAPVRSLQTALQSLHVSVWSQDNRHGVPENLMWLQALAVVALSLIYAFLAGSVVYKLLNALIVVLYMPMYLLLFVAFARLLPEKVDAWQLPLLWQQGLAALGFLSSLGILFSGLLYPYHVLNVSMLTYLLWLFSWLLLCLLPWFFLRWRS